MKSLILSLFAVCLFIGVKAQDCNYRVNKKDPFTGKEIKSIKINLNFVCMALLNNESGVRNLTLLVTFSGVVDDSARRSDSLLIKLENGNILHLAPTKSQAIPNNINHTVMTDIKVEYALPEKELRLLMASPAKDIKFTLSTISSMYTIKEKKGRALQQAARCIL